MLKTIGLRCGPTERRAAPRVKKRGAVKDKLSKLSFRGAAQRGFVCSHCYDKQFIFFYRAARRGTARRGTAFGGAVA